tara:strand:+ start:10302 stop:10727 length:426 start_codon:yes stop_codon:yes gene_type:complete
MTDLDDKLKEKVYNLAQTYGTEMTFFTSSSGTGGSYNANTGVWSSSLPVGVDASYSYYVTPPTEHARQLTGGAVEGALKITLPSKDLNATFESDYLRVGTKVKIDSSTSPQSIWHITSISRLYSGAEICAYDIELQQKSGN